VNFLAVALGVGTVVVLDQELTAFEYKEEAVPKNALANPASLIDHFRIGHKLIG
jgi:hypothetical protein